MGINGLLPLLKSIHKPCNLKKFEGKTLGVDAYGWLHRGTVACAMELARGQPTRKFVDFCMHRVRMLQHFGVKPYLVFDGDYLPSKAATEADRAKRRADSKKLGLELMNAGKPSQAYQEFQKAVDVTPEMARQLIDELKTVGVQYIVAPYEADAQMVYLERKGVIQGILSEDSDLLVFGAKCLLTKLDQYGNCVEINKADFCACKEVTLTGWSDKEFRQMAILSGCDYLSNINNMGLKTAYRMVRKHKNIEKVLRMLQFDGKFHVPKGYLEDFYQAEFTFLHQRVFCPKAQGLVFHTDPEHHVDAEKMQFIGAYVPPEIAQGVAKGELNPMSKQPMIVQGPARMNRMLSAPPLSVRSHQQRSISLSSAAELKKGKPIETFFMPKRIPLAELDPNCFTPSPSQQDALRRNSGPWTTSPIPRQYLNPSSAPQLPRNAPATAQAQTGRSISNPTISEPRPKRLRLCADDDDSLVLPSQIGDLGRSKFFGRGSEKSPTIGRTAKSRKSRTSDITIYSDDSMEEAMLGLPDADGFASGGSSTKISIFQAETSVEVESTRFEKGGPHCTPSIGGTHSQDSVPSLTTSTSCPSSVDEIASSVDSADSPTFRLGHFEERFAFSTARSPTPGPINHGKITFTPPTTTSKASKIPLAIKTSSSAPKLWTSTTRTSLTPLQRMGASAMNRYKLPMTPPETPTFSQRNITHRRSLLGKRSLPSPEVATETKKNVVDPASTPLPAADDIESVMLMNQNGSEDMMINDSEEDEDPFSPIAKECILATRLDLAKFVYAR
ncbi:hypothetical protein BJ875DRAFT_133751 [Amylocarpus encephaloides]|uniref:Exonuclease 1 n=1 Tax=Amylocarpus encephaloides TaxID=45428 RepID=A0A9P7YCC4_9HELO|nr:hypothetical protein BJ875DRAFT_133751 [Amylocarpus encephaloides]